MTALRQRLERSFARARASVWALRGLAGLGVLVGLCWLGCTVLVRAEAYPVARLSPSEATSPGSGSTR